MWSTKRIVNGPIGASIKNNKNFFKSCNSKILINIWKFRCPSTEYNNIWKKWGAYFGVPKHQCYSKNNFCQYGCPLTWSDLAYSVPQHECSSFSLCPYKCPQSKWMWSAKRFVNGPIGASIKNNIKTFKKAVIRKFL